MFNYKLLLNYIKLHIYSIKLHKLHRLCYYFLSHLNITESTNQDGLNPDPYFKFLFRFYAEFIVEELSSYIAQHYFAILIHL